MDSKPKKLSNRVPRGQPRNFGASFTPSPRSPPIPMQVSQIISAACRALSRLIVE